MNCGTCDCETIDIAVEPALREYLPGDEPGVSLCPRCLALTPVADPPADAPDFGPLGDAFPADEAAAVPMALVLGLLSSLALYRAEITALLDRVERAGTDPLLVLDRLAADPTVDSSVDLSRRRHQLEQLL